MAGDRTAAERPLRRDALANQERVLAAAVTTMLRHGQHAPMAMIAAEAGVGVATLYRRYATREALLEALTERSFRMVLEVAVEAGSHGRSGLEAVAWFLDRTLEHRAELVLPLHGGPTDLPAGTVAVRAAVHRALGLLLARGRDDRSVRADVTPADVVVFGAMIAQPLAPGWEPAARRQTALFLRGLSPPLADGTGPT